MEVAEVPYSDSIKIEPIYNGNDTISQDGNETMLSDEEKGQSIYDARVLPALWSTYWAEKKFLNVVGRPLIPIYVSNI